MDLAKPLCRAAQHVQLSANILPRGPGVFIVPLLAVTLSLSAGSAAAFSQLVIFGDSLSDSGNVFAASNKLLPPPPYFAGRFSNGPVWAEYLAGNLGVEAAPSELGGTNYAWGLARTGGTSSVPTLIEQATGYIAEKGGSVDPTALYVVFGGGSDVRDASLISEIEQSIDNIQSIIADLANAGATDFLVANVPDIGKTPEAIAAGPTAAASATALSLAFNAGLANALSSLETALTINIIPLDVYAFFEGIIANPGALGISNVTSECVIGLTACANPQDYVFWDYIHPTAVVHEALGNFAATLVPVPAAGWLFISGLALLVASRRRSA